MFLRAFQALFFFLFIVFLLVMGTSLYLGYKCYESNDPNSMACYMTADRKELGVRI